MSPLLLFSLHQNCQEHRYQHREAFLSDVTAIYNNSLLYNGALICFSSYSSHIITAAKCEAFFQGTDQTSLKFDKQNWNKRQV